MSQTAQGWVDYIFDVVLVNLLRFLFLLVVLAPGLASVCVWAFRDVPPGWPKIVAILGQVDSGFQLGSNSYVLRMGLLAVGGLAVLLGLPVPPQGRWMWRCSWLFLALAGLSAALCSHPYEALMTVVDTALLNLVVIVAFHFRPRAWLPLAYTVSASVTASTTSTKIPRDANRIIFVFVALSIVLLFFRFLFYPDNLLYKLVKEKSRHVLRKLRRGSHDLPFRPDKKP